MDYHDDLKLPPNAVEQITNDTKEGKSDQFGVPLPRFRAGARGGMTG